MPTTTTTITISEEGREALKAFGRSHGMPEPEDLATVIEAYLCHRLGRSSDVADRPRGGWSIPVFDEGSGLSDVGVNHDRYLAEHSYHRKLGSSG